MYSRASVGQHGSAVTEPGLLWRTARPDRLPGLELGEVFIEAPLLQALCGGENRLAAAQQAALEAESLISDGRATERLYEFMHTVGFW